MFRVLIVDDEPFVREGLKILLEWEKYGFEICGEAENGVQASEMVESLNPDLIITDVKMPLMDGINLIKNIREKGRIRPKFIIVSGYNEFQYAKSALKYNVNEYLLKPVDVVELKSTLNQISIELKDHIMAEQSRNEGQKAVVHNILRSIVRGTANSEEVKQAETVLNIKDRDCIYYAMISVENNASCNNNRNSSSVNIEDIVLNCIGRENQHHLFRIDDLNGGADNYAVIITTSLLCNFGKEIKYFTEVLSTRLYEDIRRNFMLYVGKPVNSLYELNESVNSTRVAESYKFFSGNNKIIFYDEIKNLSLNNASIKKISFDTLAEVIENNDPNKIGLIIDDIFKNAMQDLIDPLVLDINIKYLIYQILRIVLEMNGDVGEIINKYEIINSQMKHLTIEKAKEIAYEFSIGCAEYLHSISTCSSSNILFKIEKYIAKNYSECLTLKSLANKFYINPAYLGQIFKKRFGLSFNDYLLKLRMEKAQSLLIKTDMKVYEISSSIGYKDCDYFIANFEKATGMTPLQYRKNAMVK